MTSSGASIVERGPISSMEGIGHLSTIEAPDEVTDILNAFLARLVS